MNFREVIDDFFKGKDYFERSDTFIWIAKHGAKKIDRRTFQDVEKLLGIKLPSIIKTDPDDKMFIYIPEFETLTIEPNEGGQYEVAVRIWSENEWKGYKINNFDSKHFLVGINTRGH